MIKFRRASDNQTFTSDLTDLLCLMFACGSAIPEMFSFSDQMKTEFRRVWARSPLAEFHFMQECRVSTSRMDPNPGRVQLHNEEFWFERQLVCLFKVQASWGLECVPHG